MLGVGVGESRLEALSTRAVLRCKGSGWAAFFVLLYLTFDAPMSVLDLCPVSFLEGHRMEYLYAQLIFCPSVVLTVGRTLPETNPSVLGVGAAVRR